MATYNQNVRRRLLDRETQEMLERRLKALFGLMLFGAGIALALALGSYEPTDSSWLSATYAPIRNLLGWTGASAASALYMVIGWGGWGIALLLLGWGMRFMLDVGTRRLAVRILVAPVWIAVTAIFASTQIPGSSWEHSFGLGGLFGDMVLGMLLSTLPFTATEALNATALLLVLGVFILGLYALGCTMAEVSSAGRFLGRGLLRVTRTNVRLPKMPERLSPNARRCEPPVSSATADPEPSNHSAGALNGFAQRHKEPPVTVAGQRDNADLIHSGSPFVEPLPEMQEALGTPASLNPEPASMVKVAKPPTYRQSQQAKAEAQPRLGLGDVKSVPQRPPLSLLEDPVGRVRHQLSEAALTENARMLESVLDDYGVKGDIVSVRPGPVVTMYELEPAPGLRASRIIGLADDIARSMSALAARVSTVPGCSVIGIELPNDSRERVMLREILSSKDFGDSGMALPLALGKDIGGASVVANLARMPHLLIAGTTGSGKSVAINTMIMSLLYRLTPDDCRLIMIDPKMLELSVYDGIPHLLSPVVTDPKKAVVALKWVVGEMEERYRRMSLIGVRNIEGYNGRVKEALAKDEMFSRTVQTGFDDETGEPVFETEEFQPEKLPYIVVIVDEMADLMMVAGKEIEACIQRLAQMARASGIHLIMATQRPSVDVITGTIKANFPTRISFQVTSKIDSRTILGEQGAEQLLGMGDMLYMAGGGRIARIHGPFVSDEEVEDVVNFLKGFGPPEYVGGVVEGPDGEREGDIDLVLGLGGNTDGADALYDQAVAVVINDRKCSTSYIQRKLAIGYNKAARLVEQMEEQGLVSAANHVGKREILAPEPN